MTCLLKIGPLAQSMICFANGSTKIQICFWLTRHAIQKESVTTCTNLEQAPIFAVRKDQRTMAKVWNRKPDENGVHMDTDRGFCAELEKEGKSKCVYQAHPKIHLRSNWVLKHNSDIPYWHHVNFVMKIGGFQPSERERRIMLNYQAFKLFLSHANWIVLNLCELGWPIGIEPTNTGSTIRRFAN